MNKYNITWDQAFKECTAHRKAYENRMELTNKLFPKADGTPWVNWVGLSYDSRNEVYEALTVSSL